MNLWRPDPIIVRAFLWRGTYLWLGTRAIASLFIGFTGSNPLRPAPVVVVVIVVLSIAACVVDAWRHGERALLANLAVSPVIVALFFAGPAILAEGVLAILGAALG